MVSASRENNLVAIEELLQRLRTPNVTDDTRRSPLHHAAVNGHATPLQLLLEAGADNDAAYVDDFTPLHLAALQGHLDIVRLLVEVGANKDQRTAERRWTPLHFAAQGGCLDVVRFLLEVGVDKDRPWSSAGLGPSGPTGGARWARRQFGAVGQSCCMRFLEGDLVGIRSRSSKIPPFVAVLARRSCGYPSEILCCRGVCEEILRTSCWNPLKDICAKI